MFAFCRAAQEHLLSLIHISVSLPMPGAVTDRPSRPSGSGHIQRVPAALARYPLLLPVVHTVHPQRCPEHGNRTGDVPIRHKASENSCRAIRVRPAGSPVSYTHLDVYKRQLELTCKLLNLSLSTFIRRAIHNVKIEKMVIVAGGGEETPVSYTHLDVYKRQLLRCSVQPTPFPWSF